GYAKRNYHLLPPSFSSKTLKKNVCYVLHDIPLESIFATRALRFTDAYAKGLNAQQAAWAARKYHRH
ncbi:hypothetical protein AGABI2DRAFT_72655, partial [Agaricus bisporus var. bisporus H97]|uniref:hypothetical protein n=1 Tax=Agaricus bisporus var. bisporus (strain H97 / ATCC MYA-4626 / FGSC 10389) TaxID=936046 RepID=UPI00029F4F60